MLRVVCKIVDRQRSAVLLHVLCRVCMVRCLVFCKQLFFLSLRASPPTQGWRHLRLSFDIAGAVGFHTAAPRIAADMRMLCFVALCVLCKTTFFIAFW